MIEYRTKLLIANESFHHKSASPQGSSPNSETTLINLLNEHLRYFGDDLLPQIVEDLAKRLNADHAFVGELVDGDSIRTISYRHKNQLAENFVYSLKHSPCENVFENQACKIFDKVTEQFPQDKMLADLSIRGYIGSPLIDSNKQFCGILVAMFERPIENEDLAQKLALILSVRAGAHIQSQKDKASLQISNSKLEVQQTQLIEAKRKAEESDHLKTAFLENISHEIRTPMNAILGFASLLESNIGNQEEQTKYLKLMRERSGTLLRIVDDILEIAQIESGTLPLNIEDINLESLMLEIKFKYEGYLEDIGRSSIKLIFDDPYRIDYQEVLQADPNRLRAILDKLLSNAIKFTQEGSIAFGCRRNKDHFEFYVSDTGIGIPEYLEPLIFERFRKSNLTSNQESAGTGIGLAVCKHLVEQMGGDI